MNYLELYPGDYLRDTKHLSLSEHGAFLVLLMAYYSTEKPLPADLPSLYRIAGAMTAPEQKAVRKVADPFFPVGDDGLRHNARADREIEKAQRRIETAKSNGKKGGRPKKDKESENPAGFDSETHRQPDGKAPHTPHAIHQERALNTHAPDSFQAPPTERGRACVLMREAGCTRTNPSHPDLIAALVEGVTPETLADYVRAAPPAIANPFAYAIKAARSANAQGASPITPGGSTHATARPSATDRVAANVERARQRDRQQLTVIEGSAERFAR